MNPQYEAKLVYYGKHLGTWAATLATFLYTELSVQWPTDSHQWTLLLLKLVPIALGVSVSIQGATRTIAK